MFTPFIYSLGDALQERGLKNQPIAAFLEQTPHWQAFLNVINEEKQKSERIMGLYEDDAATGEYHTVSEEDSNEPNDADEYDTDQAEILISKVEIEALA